jgi:hypothetical protein
VVNRGTRHDADPSRYYWHCLTRAEQAQTIRRMRAAGMNELTIASATGLSIEFIQRILGGEDVTP